MDRLVRYLNGVSFHRGLALGALVGAAIAGSTLWSRVREAQHRDAPEHRGAVKKQADRAVTVRTDADSSD
jgi:hypothetical protein